MILEIHQTLHGYQNGHQLLAGSTELTIGEKKLLLFQSDLSGPNTDDGFEHYLTGYPIEETGRYAFAKTWYAKEMKRPGCVWTHTLLISFADLGRIPDFNQIEKMFIRPSNSDYTSYQKILALMAEELLSQSDTTLELNDIVQAMIEGLYLEPEKIAVVPASSSDQYRKNTLDIWSDQWPRLRRNFTFCTGALSIRTIDEKPYDLQIVPQKSISAIERKSPNVFISYNSSDNVSEVVAILKKFPVNQRRRFLWTYGADVEGERKNYAPLLKVFETIYKQGAELSVIIETVRRYFPDKGEARLLKGKLLGKESILLDRFSELQLLRFALNEPLDFVNLEELHVEERLLKLLTERDISLNTFLQLWHEADQEKISLQFIEEIEIEEKDLLESVRSYPELTALLSKKLIPLASKTEVWKLPLETQRQLLYALFNEGGLKETYLIAMLEAGSPVLPDVYQQVGDEVLILSLNWLNGDKDHQLTSEWAKLIAEHTLLIRNWLKSSSKVLPQVYRFIFNQFNFGQIRKLDLTAQELLDIYSDLKLSSQPQVFLTTAIFSLALEPKLKNAENVIQVTFSALYNFAATSQIGKDYWAMIPKYVSYENDDADEPYNPFFAWFYLMRPAKKKNKSVPEWDYCELLTRTTVNYYISGQWSKRSFLIALDHPTAFKKAIDYCKTFNAGIRFLYELLNDLSAGRYPISGHQRNTLSSINLEI